MRLQGKRAVLLGGSSGIGLATARMLVDSGARVIISSRSEEKLQEAKNVIGGDVDTYSLDVTREEALKGFFENVGAFDHIVFTAVKGANGLFLELDTGTARNVFETKFWGQYYAAKYAAPKLREGGSITLFSGVASQKPIKGLSAIASVNGAIESLCRSLAVELGPIRVNAVSPAVVATPAYDRMPPEKRKEYLRSFESKLPVKRVGKPEDVAKAVLYLILNDYTTGTVLEVNGGYRIV